MSTYTISKYLYQTFAFTCMQITLHSESNDGTTPLLGEITFYQIRQFNISITLCRYQLFVFIYILI